MSVKVVNKLPLYTVLLHDVIDDAVKTTARDILIKSRTRAPYRKGGLRGEKNPIERVKPRHWRISYNAEYAAYQERGMRADGSRRVRNYTTAGTGAHYLERSGDEETNKLKMTIAMYSKRVKV